LAPAALEALVVKLETSANFQRKNFFAFKVVEGKDHSSRSWIGFKSCQDGEIGWKTPLIGKELSGRNACHTPIFDGVGDIGHALQPPGSPPIPTKTIVDLN